MDADVSAPQIMAVFDEYDDEVDSGDVYFIEVVIDGPKEATLATGEGVHATDRMVEELVEAGHDDEIVGYLREAFPVGPSVYLDLVPVGYNEVVAVADRYRSVEGIDDVTVASGDFVLIRSVDDDQVRVAARERLVRSVHLRFRLTGAVVSGRGPLELCVAPADLRAVRRYVNGNAPAQTLGKVIVRTKRCVA
jgi:hypothetical protein